MIILPETNSKFAPENGWDWKMLEDPHVRSSDPPVETDEVDDTKWWSWRRWKTTPTKN